MAYEVDHIFVMTAPGAPVADRLAESGLTEGASRTHRGQGTTNRRFFFENSMLEFLWVHDETEAESETTAPTQLLERWRRRDDSSPFGICFRPVADDTAPAPFPTWAYEPPYLPADVSIDVAENAAYVDEPFLFYLSWAHAPDDPPKHGAGLKTLTLVTVRGPDSGKETPALEAVSHHLELESAETHQMILEFDNGKCGETIDLRPDAPLTIRY
jgi:hypothetical protein